MDYCPGCACICRPFPVVLPAGYFPAGFGWDSADIPWSSNICELSFPRKLDYHGLLYPLAPSRKSVNPLPALTRPAQILLSRYNADTSRTIQYIPEVRE